MFNFWAVADKSNASNICQFVNLWAKIPMLPYRSSQPHMYHILCRPPKHCVHQESKYIFCDLPASHPMQHQRLEYVAVRQMVFPWNHKLAGYRLLMHLNVR